MDLNHGPSGYEPDELPDCSTPRRLIQYSDKLRDRVGLSKSLLKEGWEGEGSKGGGGSEGGEGSKGGRISFAIAIHWLTGH